MKDQGQHHNTMYYGVHNTALYKNMTVLRNRPNVTVHIVQLLGINVPQT